MNPETGTSLGDRWDADGEQLDEMVDEAQAPEEPEEDEQE